MVEDLVYVYTPFINSATTYDHREFQNPHVLC